MTHDQADIRQRAALRTDGRMTTEALDQALTLSPPQAGRRRKRPEADGDTGEARAHVSAEKFGLSVQAFVRLQITRCKPAGIKSLLRIIETRVKITAAWTLTGQADYLLRVYDETLAALNRLIQDRRPPHPAVSRVESQIVMDHFKADAPQPI